MKYITSIEQRAMREGARNTIQESITHVLTLRFSKISSDLRVKLEEISDMTQLKKLLEWAVLEPSVDAFAGHAMEM